MPEWDLKQVDSLKRDDRFKHFVAWAESRLEGEIAKVLNGDIESLSKAQAWKSVVAFLKMPAEKEDNS